MDFYEKTVRDKAKAFIQSLDDVHVDAPLLPDGRSFVEIAANELLSSADSSMFSQGFRNALIKELLSKLD